MDNSNSKNISYLGRDFDSFKQQLINYAKNYFPDTYSDFSAMSPGMMFIEMASYVGDVLSFYQDLGIQETYLQYAKNPANIYSLAYMMGYKPKVTTAAEVVVTISQTLPTASGGGPDWTKTIVVPENNVVSTENGITFLTSEAIDFGVSSSANPTEILIRENESGSTEYVLSKNVKAFSGQLRTTSFTFGEYQKFPTVTIVDENIIGISSVTDNSNNVWTEVPFLAQSTVFTDATSSTPKQDQAYKLALKSVPRRFVSRFNKDNNLDIQFGSGMTVMSGSEDITGTFFPRPLSEVGTTDYDKAYDPSNFLFSNSYGLVPVNTTLTFNYIVGNGLEGNVEANTITKIDLSKVTYDSGSVSIYVTNTEPASGGKSGDSLEDIRQNSLKSFAEQKRAVTLEDYVVRSLAMPSRYGNIAKVYASNDANNLRTKTTLLAQDPFSITLYVLAYNGDGKLISASDTIKNNLKTYLSQYIMLTDTVNIQDAYVVNIGVNYDIVLRSGYTSSDVLLKCSKALQDYFKTEKREINNYINLSEVFGLLDKVPGVQTVKKVKIINKAGSINGKEYSKFRYDTQAATRNNIVYPSCDPCIFELKYPEVDIQGKVTTL